MRANRPWQVVLRVVRDCWAPRCYELRKFLARNTGPIFFYDPDSDEDRRLLRDHKVYPENLPAIFAYYESVVKDISIGAVAEALGFHTRPSGEVFNLVVIGRPRLSASARSFTSTVVEDQRTFMEVRTSPGKMDIPAAQP
jgi:hypothetical protein